MNDTNTITLITWLMWNLTKSHSQKQTHDQVGEIMNQFIYRGVFKALKPNSKIDFSN